VRQTGGLLGTLAGAFALAWLLAALPASADDSVIDGIAAQVGSDIVLVSEVRNLLGPMESKLREAGAPENEIEALRADALERLIERALIRQVVRRAELEATDGEIEQSKVLNGMVASKVHVEEAELRAEYHETYQDQPTGGEEVRLRHLLVPFTGDSTDAKRAACASAERARVRLARGDAFDVVVSQVTEKAPGNPDLGWIHEARLASWMVPQVSGAAPGSVTEVIETDFGCNVLEVVDRRPYQPKGFDEVRQQLHERMFAERMQKEYLKFMDKLREQTYIERKGIFAQTSPVGLGTGGAGWSSGPEEDPSGF
jgi:parvulin-like peptidyl-prolyl isomerase